MIRLGHIAFSNCYPIHASVLGDDRPDWLSVIGGPPNELNELLAEGRLDVAPCSSVELARHPGAYRALSGLCIGSDGPVESIILVSRAPLRELGGETVALPTASATSRLLARLLLARAGAEPGWIDFDQGSEDPVLGGRAAAALFIGDAALRRPTDPADLTYDLGHEWTSWTGLPFVYALWQVRESVASDPRIT
ncbi:MAG: menaquinone biosynthesis protein, partial [Gemmatimonadota bacterium]